VKTKILSLKSNSSSDKSIANDSEEDKYESEEEEEEEIVSKDPYLCGKCLLPVKKKNN
jgi:hypothetical protein